MATSYSKHHNTGVMQKWVVQDVMLFKVFDWTMAFIIAFDWLLKYGRHASSISVHLACSTDMVFAVIAVSLIVKLNSNRNLSKFFWYTETSLIAVKTENALQ